MKRLSISPRASRTLDEIADYTENAFGRRQALQYVSTALERCRAIAQDRLPHRSCREVLAPDARFDLRFVRSGEHYIVFTETSTEVVIVDFIHQSSDVNARLAVSRNDPG